MSIPIIIFLGLFIVFSFFWVVFSFFNVFHALKFGIRSVVNEISFGIYTVVSLALAGGALFFVLTNDWSQTIDIIIAL